MQESARGASWRRGWARLRFRVWEEMLAANHLKQEREEALGENLALIGPGGLVNDWIMATSRGCILGYKAKAMTLQMQMRGEQSKKE